MLLIDNYDSFTFNLVQYLGDLGISAMVRRNDQITIAEAVTLGKNGIVISPGPCSPNEAGICLELIQAAAEAELPLLGVCLGHQALGQVFGGHVVRAPTPVHGKVATITRCDVPDGHVLDGLPRHFRATRYHSLVVARDSLPECLEVTAETDGLIMAMRHRTKPLHGVQFHPESLASEHGHAILKRFISFT